MFPGLHQDVYPEDPPEDFDGAAYEPEEEMEPEEPQEGERGEGEPEVCPLISGASYRQSAKNNSSTFPYATTLYL
jgi:hypothetical protein